MITFLAKKSNASEYRWDWIKTVFFNVSSSLAQQTRRRASHWPEIVYRTFDYRLMVLLWFVSIKWWWRLRSFMFELLHILLTWNDIKPIESNQKESNMMLEDWDVSSQLWWDESDRKMRSKLLNLWVSLNLTSHVDIHVNLHHITLCLSGSLMKTLISQQMLTRHPWALDD